MEEEDEEEVEEGDRKRRERTSFRWTIDTGTVGTRASTN